MFAMFLNKAYELELSSPKPSITYTQTICSCSVSTGLNALNIKQFYWPDINDSRSSLVLVFPLVWSHIWKF